MSIYLASAGIGSLTLVDFDRVERSNLSRQIVHRTADIDRNKVDSARDTLLALNPHVQIDTIPSALDEETLRAEITRADIVIDASDNFETRFALNQACYALHCPLVCGAATQMLGQISAFDFRDQDSPCYRCLFDDTGESEEPCALVGVFSPLLGIIGSVQAAEALKLLLNMGDSLVGRLILFDAFKMQWRSLTVPKDPLCPICTGITPTER